MSDKLTDEKLAEILTGLDRVKPGPWTAHEKGDHPRPYVCGPMEEFEYGEDRFLIAYLTGMNTEAHAAHIARLDPDTVRALVTELQAFREGAK